MDKIVVWKSRANMELIQLIQDGNVLELSDMLEITKVEVKYLGVYYGSDIYPEAFDWTTYAAAGQVSLRLGLTPMDIGSDACELVIYTNDSPAGIVWMQLAIRVTGEATIA